MNWLTAHPGKRALQVLLDFPLERGDWTDHQRACTAEGMCPVCLGPLSGLRRIPGFVAAGNCYNPECPVSPCQWAITVEQETLPGALMFAPLGGKDYLKAREMKARHPSTGKILRSPLRRTLKYKLAGTVGNRGLHHGENRR